MSVSGPAPRFGYPPRPLLPGQQERVRTGWTRLTQVLAVAAIALTPWLLLRVGAGIYVLYVDSDWARDDPLGVRVYMGYVTAELVLAVALAGAYWLLGRRLQRSGGRPTRRVLGLLVTTTVVLGLLTVDAFTFALVRAGGGG